MDAENNDRRRAPLAAMPASAPLPNEVEAWLRALQAAQTEDSEDYPPGVRKRLLYVLSSPSQRFGPKLDLQTIELRRDGTVGGEPRAYQHQPHAPQPPRFLRPSDRAILRAVAVNGTGEGFADTLRAIIATGRGRWGAWDGPALHEAPAVPGRIAWDLAEDGSQRPHVELPAPLVPMLLAGPWYADPGTGAVGPVEAGLPDRIVRAMLSAPALAPALAGQVAAELARRAPQQPLPQPALLAPPVQVRAPLQPCLRLLSAALPPSPHDAYARANLAAMGRQAMQGRMPGPVPRTPLARLTWRYGDVVLPADATKNVVVQDGRLLEAVRDPMGEIQAVNRLRRLGFVRVGHRWYLPFNHPNAADLALREADPEAWIDLVLHDVPELRAEGWAVEADADFPVRIATATGDVVVRIEEGSGIDWFDLDLGVMVDGERISLVPALLNLIGEAGAAMALAGLALAGLAQNGMPDGMPDDAASPLLLPLPDGRLLAVPFSKLQPILAPLLELMAGAQPGPDGTLRLSRRSAADLALLEAEGRNAGLAWSGGDAVRALGRGLREHGGIPPCPAPPGFGATLRPYQADGLAWLQFLGAAGLGGVLADDMGLGKTVQALAHLAVDQAAGRLDRPALVICPTSVAPNWQAEAARFAPMLRILVLHGKERAARFPEIAGHDLVITTYPLLARDHEVLAAQEWHAVLLDEAQTIKNPLAATSRLARTLRARQRLCLSGTPLENHLGELWSLFDFLMPGFLGDQKGFARQFRTPIERAGNTERSELLRRRITPFLLRRTKEEVAADLPAKTEIEQQVAMGDAQRAVYEGIRLTMHAKVRAAIAKRGLAGSGIIILDAMLKLRQACCDPRLLRLTTAQVAKAGSAKLERLLDLLPRMVEEGRRVLLFSQFTSMLALIEPELARLGLPHVLLTGDTADRATPVRRFQAGEVPLFLISLKAGGVGLNLTAADTVIHYDPWWNPAVEDQATDRAHRIGQDKPVFVHRLITQGTIEEKMLALKARKQALADGILGAGAAATLALTEGDLDALFTPAGG